MSMPCDTAVHTVACLGSVTNAASDRTSSAEHSGSLPRGFRSRMGIDGAACLVLVSPQAWALGRGLGAVPAEPPLQP